jgi:hypothetical protein
VRLLEMRRAQLLVNQVIGVHDHARVVLDVGLDLELPLVGRHHVDGLDRAQERARRRVGGEQLAVGAVAREAVAALRRAHDHATRLDHLRAAADMPFTAW